MTDFDQFQDAQTLVRSDYQGSFDAIVNGCAEGWVYDRAEPTRRVQVEIRDRSRTIASAQASLYRHDLEQAGLGDGYCHFSIPVPPRLADGLEHTLIARISGSDFVLDGIQTYRASGVELSGVIDELDGLTLRGRLSSGASDWRFADLIAEGEVVAEIPIPPLGTNESFAVEIPARLEPDPKGCCARVSCVIRKP